jgi:hypothetical protein
MDLSSLDKAKSPILCYSGGKDSHLLLHLIREVRLDVPVLIFHHFWPKEHKNWVFSVIKDLNLVAFSYRPSMLKYSQGSVISLYPFGASTIPVISDPECSSDCGLEWGRRALSGSPLAHFPWDVVLTGSRKSDSHPLVPSLDFTGTNIITPLWDWTEEEVWNAIKERNIQTSDTSSDPQICTRCLQPEGRIVYCPKQNRNIESIGT